MEENNEHSRAMGLQRWGAAYRTGARSPVCKAAKLKGRTFVQKQTGGGDTGINPY